MANYLVAQDTEGVTIATCADLNRTVFFNMVCALASQTQESIKVYAVRINPYHEPMALGEKFAEPSARIIDQEWQFDPSSGFR